ncbi:MAG: dienelactone hydrolase family protein [Pseudomonadota bacterium]
MSELKSEHITSALDGFALSAVRAASTRSAPLGGVVVVQEIFGVSAQIREICGFFADAGYDALAPSFFDRVERGFSAGVDGEGFAKGVAAVRASSWDQVAGDIQAAIDALPQPCFITGFCWGGTATWLAAARCTGLTAASSFYGRMIVDLLDDAPRIPIQFHYGARDANIPEDNRAKVQAAAPNAPLYLYDAGHGFCRRGGRDFDEASCDLALKRTLDWFARWRA